jgi:hypothetical protein
MNDATDGMMIIIFIIISIIVIALVVILREVILWYWKVNSIVENQRKTNYLLTKLVENKGYVFTDEEKKWFNQK